MKPDAATIVHEWTWKTPAMRDMAVAVCRLALDRGVNGTFSALDLAMHGQIEQGGSGIAGSIFGQLAEDGILAPVGVFADGEFLRKTVRNAHGNPIGLWRLASASHARALLARHAQPQPAPVQIELFEVTQ
jgi:hypothetical protein